LGMAPMSIIDIGGGFPGDNTGHGVPSFVEMARVIRKSIGIFCESLHRPMESVQFIAEPGRYFVSASTTIATKVYSRKGGNNNYQALYVDNGVYGSFNTVVYDHAFPVPKKLSAELAVIAQRNGGCGGKMFGASHLSSGGMSDCSTTVLSRSNSCESLNSLVSDTTTAVFATSSTSPVTATCTVATEVIPTAVFGPTCDGLDQMCNLDNTTLERCQVGDWLIWEYQGAYTHTASFVFNGYTHFPNKIHCFLA